MRLALLPVAFCCLAGCEGGSAKPVEPPLAGIVSLDLCADQMVLKLADKRQIKAVSREIALDAEFGAITARGIPRIKPTVEEIVALRPATVVKSYGGGPMLDSQLARFGIKVVPIDYTATLADVHKSIRNAARQLGGVANGEATVRTFERQLAQAQHTGSIKGDNRPSLLYVTPGGVTTGPGSLIDEVMVAAGYENYVERPGWISLPLEEMAGRKPDAIFYAFFNSPQHNQDAWSSARHEVAQQQMKGLPSVSVSGSKVSCGNWMLGDVVEELSKMRQQL